MVAVQPSEVFIKATTLRHSNFPIKEVYMQNSIEDSFVVDDWYKDRKRSCWGNIIFYNLDGTHAE